METQLILYENADNRASGLHFVDLGSEISIPLTYTIGDFREPEKRRTEFSKDITIPGTKENCKIFGHLFDIDIFYENSASNYPSGTTQVVYNTGDAKTCVVIQDGLEIFNGVLKVNSVIINKKEVVFNARLLGKLGSLFTVIGEDLLYGNPLTAEEINDGLLQSPRDLNLDEYDHILRWGGNDGAQVGIRTSWGPTTFADTQTSNATIIKNGSNFSSIVSGSQQAITSTFYDSTFGRLGLNFTNPHGLAVGDVIFLLILSTTQPSNQTRYNGHWTVTEIVDTDSLVINCLYGLVATESGIIRKQTATGDGYIYPMINYKKYVGSLNNWNTDDFFPSVYVKTVIDKIFSQAGYTYSSSFFNTQFFKRLFVTPTIKEALITQEAINNRSFKTTRTTSGTVNPDGENLIFQSDTPPYGQDPGNNWNTTTGVFTAPANGLYKITINFKGTISKGSSGDNFLRYGIAFKNLTTNTIPSINTNGNTVVVYDSVTTTTPNPQVRNDTVVWDNYYLTAGHQFAVWAYANWTDIDAEVNSTLTVDYLSTSLIGETVNLSEFLPRKLKKKDFLTSIFKMFNLFVRENPDINNQLIIETKDEFYSTEILDWTNKLDYSKESIIKPLAADASKIFRYRYKEDKDDLNTRYKNEYNEIFGEYTIDTENEFNKNETVTEISFSPTPIRYETGKYLSDTIKLNTDNTAEYGLTNARILYYTGFKIQNVGSGYTVTENGVNYNSNLIYPFSGHVNDPLDPTIDLNFGYAKRLFYLGAKWTTNNLFNTYHNTSVSDITDINSKLLSANFVFKAQDINLLDFSKLIYIDGTFYKLNQIIDYVKDNSVKVELIKSFERPRFVTTSGIGIGGGVVNVGGGAVASMSSRLPIFNIGGTPLMNENISYGQDSAGFIVSNVQVTGINNQIGPNASNLAIVGNNNNIGEGATNVVIMGGNDNIVTGSDVSILNGSGLTITSSDITVVNDNIIDSNGIVSLIVSVVDASEDIVGGTSLLGNVIDAGSVAPTSLTQTLDAAEDQVLNPI